MTIDGKAGKDSSLVERWIEDQREWQKTAMAYLDSMVKNDDFLVHLGNAMRGSLLAGKSYPGVAAPAATQDAPAPADDRLDHLLFAIHQLQGQVQDLTMTLDEVRKDLRALITPDAPVRRRRKATPAKATGKTRSSTQAGAKGLW